MRSTPQHWTLPAAPASRRVWRGEGEEWPFTCEELAALALTGSAIRVLCADLTAILDVVDPRSAPNATGTRIRQLLFSACSEVESAWRAILRSNAYPSTPDRLTTNDYVKLCQPLDLASYSITLPGRDYEPVRPYRSWCATKPTESLSWYSAYHAVKHDREHNSVEGSLATTIAACSAALAMAVAQFGQSHFLPGGRFGQWTLYLDGVGCCR